MNMEKLCISCNHVKQISSFYNVSHEKCRSCTIINRRQLDKTLNPVTKRKCLKCDEIKNISEFYKDHNSVKCMCKTCYCNKTDISLKTNISAIRTFVLENSNSTDPSIIELQEEINNLEDKLMNLRLKSHSA
jgi:hypothetical protein